MFSPLLRFFSLSVSCMLAALLLLSSCQNQNAAPHSYSDDGYMGITSVNPNMPTSPTHHTNYAVDARMAREALADLPQATVSRVTMNGPVAHVRLQLSEGMSAQQKQQVRQEAESRLRAMLPRYTIKISMNDTAAK